MLKYVLTLIVSLFFLSGFAQKYSFVTYSTEDGLPQSQVTAMTQDKDGYLWIGTLGGLAKFDGTKFTSYSSNQGLLNNRITSLSFFNEKLWVGDDGGISIIKDTTIKQVAFKGNGNDKSRSVSAIYCWGIPVRQPPGRRRRRWPRRRCAPRWNHHRAAAG